MAEQKNDGMNGGEESGDKRKGKKAKERRIVRERDKIGLAHNLTIISVR